MKDRVDKEPVSILVVTHNHATYVEALIDSLIKQSYENVFFCDAQSTDGTLEILKRSPFKNNVLSKTVLEGFSKNNNDLIRHFNLNSQYYLLLNPDTFFDTDFLSILLQEAKENIDLGIVAPILKYPDGRVQTTWKKFPSVWTVLKKRTGKLKATSEHQMDGPNIDWCLGACMLISNKLLKPNSSLLDERYRLYCEDIDICFEAHVKGLKVIGLSDSVVFHNLHEMSSKNIFSKYNWWNIQSILKFALKWNTKYFFKKR